MTGAGRSFARFSPVPRGQPNDVRRGSETALTSPVDVAKIVRFLPEGGGPATHEANGAAWLVRLLMVSDTDPLLEVLFQSGCARYTCGDAVFGFVVSK